jgi:hypothetical protein
MSSNLTRAVVIPAVAAVFGLAVYWAMRPEASVAVEQREPTAVHEWRADATEAHGANRLGTFSASASTPHDQGSADAQSPDSEARLIAEYTLGKYRYLIDDFAQRNAGSVGRLEAALVARDRVHGELKAARESGQAGDTELAKREQDLARAEQDIRDLLNPGDYSTYATLRDSDLEQWHLDEYAGGVSNVAPLGDSDRRAILKTKLAYKERFRQLLLDSGLDRKDLSAAEREYAIRVTTRAMEDYRRSYLQEVRQYLANQEQFELLSNYENTEFTAEVAKLRSPASGG